MKHTLIKFALLICLIAVTGCASHSGKSTEEMMALVEKAERYYSLGMLTDAEAKYRKILSLNPDYYEAWLKLGNIYVRTDQLEAAILAYQRCTEKSEKDVRCWNNLALARVKQALQTLDEGKQRVTQESVEYHSLELFQQSILQMLTNRER